jgi:alkanesulfonate monooxygenase SsuD/methylene tetrahydromethanopterin reductase-like flavin-dependent oxidoreductase (luciferase family)
VQERIPIYLGAIAPRSVRQVGEIADGWLPFMFSPHAPELLLDPLREGAEAGGRALEEIDVAPVVPVSIADDAAQARDGARPWIAFYLGAMGAKEKNFYVELAERYGFGAAARECQERFLGGDRVGAMAAIPDELVEFAAIACTPAELPDRLAAYEAAGADTLVVAPGGDRAATVRLLAEAGTPESVG